MQSQERTAKGANANQLAVYFAIGKYLSKNTRRFVYGSGALKAISDRLLHEMPGLRGFSETSLKKMRLFYENWQILDSESGVTEHELQLSESSVATDQTQFEESSVATDELQLSNNQIDIYHTISIPNIAEFPIEDFFNVPFTHHVDIFSKVKAIDAHYYYIHRSAEE